MSSRVTKVVYDAGVHVMTIDTTINEILEVQFSVTEQVWMVKHYVSTGNGRKRVRITTIPARQLRFMEEWAP